MVPHILNDISMMRMIVSSSLLAGSSAPFYTRSMLDVEELAYEMRMEALRDCPEARRRGVQRVISVLVESNLLLAFIKREDRLKPADERISRLTSSGEIIGAYVPVATIEKMTIWFLTGRRSDDQ